MDVFKYKKKCTLDTLDSKNHCHIFLLNFNNLPNSMKTLRNFCNKKLKQIVRKISHSSNYTSAVFFFKQKKN